MWYRHMRLITKYVLEQYDQYDECHLWNRIDLSSGASDIISFFYEFVMFSLWFSIIFVLRLLFSGFSFAFSSIHLGFSLSETYKLFFFSNRLSIFELLFFYLIWTDHFEFSSELVFYLLFYYFITNVILNNNADIRFKGFWYMKRWKVCLHVTKFIEIATYSQIRPL